MRFLADESCDFRVVARLRKDGHDVEAVCETSPGASDVHVLGRARDARRVLLTEDRDFGQLVFAASFENPFGVLYLRCTESARPVLADEVASLVTRLGDDLEKSFVVWSPARVRIRRPSPLSP